VKSYDVAIIGAGINGCALAYELHNKNQRVIVFEQVGIASGGSGAAGAFINPKISKSGPLKELIEVAYLYSLDFYKKNFSEQTTAAPLLHISKYSNDNEKVDYFKKHTSLQTQNLPLELQNRLSPYAQEFSSVYLKDNAVVEAKEICEAMLKDIELNYTKVNEPKYYDGFWHIDEVRAKTLVFCTGAYEEVIKEDYITLRRIYGQRCEIESSTVMNETVHHEVSISATKKNGRIAIGASHYLNEEEIPKDEDGANALLDLASKTLVLKDIKLHNTFTGMRSGSNDYLPIVGPLIDAVRSLDEDMSALEGNKEASLVVYESAYMINGVGGYGFVLAPYLAKLMSDHLVNKERLPEFLEPKRFYYRNMKKRGQNR